MSSFEIGKMVGVICGILLGLLICFVSFRFLNKNRKTKTEYDERQKAIRGIGYQLGFWTMAILLAVLMIVASGNIVIPVSPMVLYFSIIFMGIAVMVVYCIWNEAYFGMNNISSRWYFFMLFFAIINFVFVFVAIRKGQMIVDGVLESPFINFLGGMIFLVVFLTTVIKKMVDKKQESEI